MERNRKQSLKRVSKLDRSPDVKRFKDVNDTKNLDLSTDINIAHDQPIELIDEKDNPDDKLVELKQESAQLDLFEENCGDYSSSYQNYFDHNLSENELSALKNKYDKNGVASWEVLHQILFMRRIQISEASALSSSFTNFSKPLSNPHLPEDLTKYFGVNKVLSNNWLKLNKNAVKVAGLTKTAFTPLQNEIFSIIHQYVSLHYPCCKINEDNDEERRVYCLHTLNHILQARTQVLKNNKLLSKLTQCQIEQEEHRDQGIARPKVLILVPFRDRAFKIINTFVSLLRTEKKFEISYLKRFKEEFGPVISEDEQEEATKKKPLDYRVTFAGNTDEHFRIGIALLHSAFRLYAPFYSSDIIIASPLGLRTIIGERGEDHYEHDFLSSIEVLVVDNADTMMMQNWEHVIHIMKHMHLQPKESHGVDFSRVRTSSLDGKGKHYCQTIMFSSVSSPQMSSLLTKYCFNYKGLAVVKSVLEKGSICAIPKAVPQIFHKLNISSEPFVEVSNIRFNFFVSQILKQFKEKKMTNILIYVPQYFDFVRLRNHMRREKKEASGPHFGYICEYTKATEVGKARRRFLTEKFPILLYTERYHYYHRPNIRGIRHILFYELPTFPHFYSELCNMVHMTKDDATVSSNSVVTLYSKYDAAKLVSVVGDKRGGELLRSQKHVHMFLTGNNV